ncbi:alpha/beta hydrolase [Streptomyces sp. NA04227]|uniref:alpha/beta fold hydrolase n=1 Tax=Streptomyces sp. NA04227 TaxID=2742136 RepID=UPI00158FB3C8|nr:alpha/beta hydrolase [Streptomyces sp. NA04227]QKW05324.1 alpha/beta hydrolase [Streptomyces sp. NA04227]
MPATASFTVESPRGPQTASITYDRFGSGEPLLLLHGIGHHWQAWEPVIPALSAQYDVIAADLPGFGTSPGLPDGLDYDLPTITRVLAAFNRSLGIERPHVAGNSLGGLISLELGRQKEVRSVTALAPAGFYSAGELIYASRTLRAMRFGARNLPLSMIERLSRSAAGRSALASTIYARPGRRAPEAVVAETLALRNCIGFMPTLAAGHDLRFTDALAGLPVTIAWGNKDRILLPRQGIRAKRLIPDARLIRLPGCGHVPMNDDPALVARVILDTVAR